MTVPFFWSAFRLKYKPQFLPQVLDDEPGGAAAHHDAADGGGDGRADDVPAPGAAVVGWRARQRDLAAGHGLPAGPPARDAERDADAEEGAREGGARHQEALGRRQEVQGRLQGG